MVPRLISSSPVLFGDVVEALHKSSSPARARGSERFFKCGPGQYGEGDLFIGVTVPDLRKLAQRFQAISGADLRKLLRSEIHEHRYLALLILVRKFEFELRSGTGDGSQIVTFYLSPRNRRYINNWDLVDCSAAAIAGEWCRRSGERHLEELVRSKSLWDRRIAVVGSYAFIRAGSLARPLAIIRRLVGDDHDLMHKACGWMLREVGKRDKQVLEEFLKTNYTRMSRTTLRYAIERFSPTERAAYLAYGQRQKRAGR